VIALDPIVPILGRVMKHLGEKVVDNAQQRCSQIGGDLSWPVASDQRGEALHPPVDRHVIDLDAAFGQEFFDITVGQARSGATSAPPTRSRRAGTGNPRTTEMQNGDEKSPGHATTRTRSVNATEPPATLHPATR
jgi:hypothetical protein